MGHGFQYSQIRSKGDNAGWPKQPPSSLLYPFGHIIPLTDICLYVDHPCSDPLYSHSNVIPCFSPVTSVTQCPDSCQVSPWSSVNGQGLASWQGRRCGASGAYPAHGSASLDYGAGGNQEAAPGRGREERGRERRGETENIIKRKTLKQARKSWPALLTLPGLNPFVSTHA